MISVTDLGPCASGWTVVDEIPKEAPAWASYNRMDDKDSVAVVTVNGHVVGVIRGGTTDSMKWVCMQP